MSLNAQDLTSMAFEKTPLLMSNKGQLVPPAPFTAARIHQESGIRLPQSIAHRGYKAAYPENTLAAFKAAVDIGAHALETDIHLSKDKVVVLSHDATLQRCFGQDTKIADCDWSYLSTLETLASPKQHMPRLLDLLAYLALPENADIWVLLDIKRDDDAHELMSQVAATIACVKPCPTKPWHERIVLGPWDASYIEVCKQYLPGFPMAYIGWSVPEANKILRAPGEDKINFNLLLFSLLGPGGGTFMRAARQAGRHLFVWTVNQEIWMEWCIRKGVDGVITDDPKLYREVCERWESGAGAERRSITQIGREVVIKVVMAVIMPFVWMQTRPSPLVRNALKRLQGE